MFAMSGMLRQSTWQLPPVHCAPHSMMWPAMVPLASLSKSSSRQPNRWTMGASAHDPALLNEIVLNQVVLNQACLRLDNFLLNNSGSSEQQQNGRSGSERWPPVPPRWLVGRNAFLNSVAQRGIGYVTLARRMNRAFPLQSAQSFCRASRTRAQVSVKFLHLAGIEFTVEGGVQLSGPRFVSRLFGHVVGHGEQQD